MTVVVPLAPGFEEIEAVTVIDVLRRANLRVIVAGVEPGPIRGAHGITVQTDMTLADLVAEPIEMVVLPGGMPGAETLRDSADVQALVARVASAGGRIGAICAAPMALGPGGLAQERTVTCYPGFEKRFEHGAFVEDRVVIDGPIVTSRGVGTALEFALDLVALLAGATEAERLADAMLVSRSTPARVL